VGNKKRNWVSASDAGRASFCPHHLELKHKGSKPSASAKAARTRGDNAHDELNKAAEDKRCFVASHLYGIDHGKTVLLRRFRDRHLTEKWYGQWSIGVYYALSPALVDIARRVKVVDWVLRLTVNGIIKRISEK